MNTETLTYSADGLTMESILYCEPAAGTRPGVLVFPDAAGLGEQAMASAQKLSRLGYVALACDLYGQRQVLAEEAKIMQLLGEIRHDVARIRARAQGALAALQARPEVDPQRVAAIGYCFGGTMALELARSGAAVAGVVGFHSGLSAAAPQDSGHIRGRILVCIGADDPLIPPEQRAEFEREMRAGKVNWQLSLYGGAVHGFTNPGIDRRGRPDTLRYDAQSDARSWREMLGLFEELFPGTSSSGHS